jgi:hypothetical protein
MVAKYCAGCSPESMCFRCFKAHRWDLFSEEKFARTKARWLQIPGNAVEQLNDIHDLLEPDRPPDDMDRLEFMSVEIAIYEGRATQEGEAI